MPIAAGTVTATVNTRDAQITALYDEHAAALRRYALRLTGDRGRAEDVVQETLLRAWTHLEITGNTARAWLFTVARHLIIDQSRSSRARHEVGSLEDAPEPAGPDEVNATLDRMLIAKAFGRLSPSIARWFAGRTTAAAPPRALPPISGSPRVPLSRGCTTPYARCGSHYKRWG